MSEKTINVLEKIVVPAVLALGLIVVSIWGFAQAARAEALEDTASGLYQRAFLELSDNMSELDTSLSKLQIVNTPARQVLLLDDVWRLSGSAVSLMSQIPASHVDTGDLNRFLVQLGDYAHTLTEKALKGEALAEADYDQLSELQVRCRELSGDLAARVENGDMPTAAVNTEGYYTPAEEEHKDPAGIDEFPTLIYDGPFSESTEKRQPQGLSSREVSQAEAKAAAEQMTGCTLQEAGTTEGDIATYDFTGEMNGGELYVSVTRQGGKILYYMGSAAGATEGKPEEEEAARFRDTALFYLSKWGYGDMTATYAQYYAGSALVSCAAVQDGVILYNDLVKVWVDRSELTVIGLDVKNYLYSHVQRVIPTPTITMEQAEACLSKNLHVEGRALALIPLTPNTECLCYEFKGTYGDESYIVYINAKTGAEEQVYQIIDAENGTLVL